MTKRFALIEHIRLFPSQTKEIDMDHLLLAKLASRLPPNSAGAAPEILTAASLQYDVKRQVMNTKFQFKPSAIVLVETSEQVSEIVKFANMFPTEIVLRVRSGGHDHEGECSGTDTLLIDFSKMNKVHVTGPVLSNDGGSEQEPIVTIGPGARFRHIKPVLDASNIGLAHGTCKTVAIAGYIMGGGWGPWTRSYGMGCERLIGATIVLGDGAIKTIGHGASYEDEEERRAGEKLMWALRGGGGLSYGIVTELKFKAFSLPKDLCSFSLSSKCEWPHRTALDILKCWEDAITDPNPQLIGTNLKIVARHLGEDEEPNPDAVLDCTFNGYFAGTKDEAIAMIASYFKVELLSTLVVQVQRRSTTNLAAPGSSAEWPFEDWDRHVPSKVKEKELLGASLAAPGADPFHDGIVLEDDGPAPHKISSRLVDAEGWNDEGRKALICSLQSPLVPRKQDTEHDGVPNDFALSAYITLGAITGPFYANYEEERALPSAFPYKKRRFTIQYQAWWDQYLNTEELPKKDVTTMQQDDLANVPWINRAEDWIEACRSCHIPNTSGAFISFKDSSVRTETYFADSYKELRAVKRDFSRDKYVLFRTRKTII
jgi:hypothetical protein